MVRLTPPDPAAHPPGSTVRVRPPSEWAGDDAGCADRPLYCEYDSGEGWLRRFGWTAELDGLVGREMTVERVYGGLPVVGGFRCHPDWLATVGVGTVCTCDLHTVLMIVGCRCGAIPRWRG
jgi:hypothetical protein